MWAELGPTKEDNCFFPTWARMFLLLSLLLKDVIAVSSHSSTSFEVLVLPLTLLTPGDKTQNAGHAVQVLSC